MNTNGNGVSLNWMPDVVDKSSYRPDSESVRAYKFNPAGGSSGTPVYDYVDGNVPKNDPVTPVVLAIRSGKLDKADVDRLRQAVLDDAKSKNDSEYFSKVKDSMDKILGIDSVSSTSSEK